MNESFYYPAQCLQKYLTTMKQFIAGSEPLLIITGDRGFGKTALLSAFYHSGEAPADMLVLKGRNSLTADKFITTLSSEWHLDAPIDTDNQEQALTDLLKQMSELPNSALLVIDNADRIPIATLAAIMHLCIAQKTNQVAMKFILFGRPSFEKIIDNLHLSDIGFDKLELKPLTKEETHHFLLETIKSMQPLKTTTITEPTVAKIYQRSFGIPKDIAQMAEEIIQTSALNHDSPVSQYSLDDMDQTFKEEKTKTDNSYYHTQTQPVPKSAEQKRSGWLVKILCLILLVGVFYGFHSYQHKLYDHSHDISQPTLATTKQTMPPLANHDAQPIKIIPKKPIIKPADAPYSWQVMASTNQVQLVRLQEQLQQIHQPSYIKQQQIGDKKWYTLNIGHYTTKKAANKDRLSFANIILKHHPWLKHD